MVGCFILYKIHEQFKNTGKYKASNNFDDSHLVYVIPMFLLATFIFILAMCCFSNIENIINGYFNPEYWALEKVLTSVRPTP